MWTTALKGRLKSLADPLGSVHPIAAGLAGMRWVLEHFPELAIHLSERFAARVQDKKVGLDIREYA
jgi:hypothetical protein